MMTDTKTIQVPRSMGITRNNSGELRFWDPAESSLSQYSDTCRYRPNWMAHNRISRFWKPEHKALFKS